MTSQSEHTLHRLERPALGKPLSFSAAYARAANRYKFGVGKFPTYAYKDNAVFRIHNVEEPHSGTQVPAESVQNDILYVMHAKVGTPGVTLRLLFETASSDLWVLNSRLSSVSTLSGHTVYNPADSSTFKDLPGTWQTTFGDDLNASGDVCSDTLTIGSITIPDQAIQLPRRLQPMPSEGYDGVIGLGWPSLNLVHPNRVTTPMENMMATKLIELPVFTCKLGRGDSAGFFSFGSIDSSVARDSISYTAVDNSQGLWQVPSSSYSLNSDIVGRPGNTCVMDTGTTLLLVDDTVVTAIYGTIQGAKFDSQNGAWIYPENTSLPEISFAVGNQLYKVNHKDLSFGPAHEGYVFGGIQSRGDLSYDVFGDVFLKSVYAVFNQREVTLGLAQRDD